MATIFNFTKFVNTGVLSDEIVADATIVTALVQISAEDDAVTIEFVSDLAAGEVTALDAVVAAHGDPANPVLDLVWSRDGGAPDDIEGNDTDIAIDFTTLDVRQRVAGAWGAAVSLLSSASDIGDLSDVDLTTVTPNAGDHLEFDGTDWVPGTAGGGGTFLSHSDTPGSYSALFFPRVNAGATALEFVTLSLSDLPGIALDDLSDVTITSPTSGDVLAFTGTIWEPQSGMTPGAHETTHRKGGSDEILADMLDIDFLPVNYTRTTDPPNSTNVAELGSHLHGIDLELATFALVSHTHVEADITDLQAYLLNINAESIDDLSDVDTTTSAPSVGEHLEWDGSNWVPGSAGAGSTTFLALTDTPGVFTGAGSQFVKVNAVANALEFVADPGFLTDITGENIGDLSDVIITTVASGEILTFTGSVWENQTLAEAGVAAASHTHVEADITDLQAYALASVTLTAGEGLQGGGDLTTNRTFDLDINSLTADGAPDGGADFVVTYDDSAGGHKKVLLNNLPGGGGGGTAAQSVVQARRSTTFSDAADTWQTLTFDVTDIENNSLELEHDNTTTSRINLVKTGPVLIFYASVVSATASSTTEARVLLNGTTEISGSFQKISPQANGSFGDLDNVFAFIATAGDFIELQFQDTGTTGNQDVNLETNVIFGAVRLTGVSNELFTDLADTPGAYTGSGSFFVRVNSGATGLEFVADPGFITDIMGEAFLDLSDTPAVYTGAGSQFVKVNAGATAVEFVADPGFLTNINSENITDLSDVTITAVASGELLTFTGTVWENQTLAEAGIAAASHTHVEADITDLQAYLLSITGESFLDLADTPATYATAGSRFVKVNAGATALEFVVDPGFLTDITGENIGDLNDVTIITVADGELLRFNGTVWVNNTLAEAGVAPASHTHVEADITDLQSYLLNITAEDFTDLSDTPANYTGAGTQFVRVNAGATALEFVVIALGDLPAIALDDLSDVDLTTAAPVSGDVLSFNGTDWVPASGMAPGAHASTHISAGTDEIDGDRLDIDFIPVNYTRDTSPSEVTLVVELTAHLKGIDVAIAAAGSTNFLGLTDTPANYTGAGSRFVKVNAGATALEFVSDPGFLTDITGEAFNDLSDVVITSVASGEIVKFDGANWINNTLTEAGIASASHTHVEADITDLQAYLLNITNENFTDLADTPANYTGAGSRFVKVNSGATALEFVADPGYLLDITNENIGDLSDVTITTVATGELLAFTGALWENQTLAELSIATTSHAATHVAGGSDEIDGDRLDIDFSPVNYTPDTTPAQVTLTNELTAHLAGIDNEMLTVGSLPKWDRQMADSAILIQTTSTTFVDVPGLTVTTKDLGSGQNGSYLIHFSATIAHATQKEAVEFQLVVDGTPVAFSVATMNFSALFVDTQFSWYEDPIINNKIIKVQWRQTRSTGSVGARTAEMTDRRLIISGVPSNAVVV